MGEDCRSSVRELYAWEIREARRVFGSRLDYDVVRIHECAAFPDRINRIGAFLKRLPPPDMHNAVTIGNHCYFPVRLLQAPVDHLHPEHYKLTWLMHELTHAWQFQHMGWSYLIKALKAQFNAGIEAYNFGGENGLLERLEKGAKFLDFNLEQQGDIVKTYYERIVRGQDTRAWNRYIAEVGGDDRPMDVV